MATGGNEIWLVEAVSGLETIEPLAPRCALVFPQPFHPLPATAVSVRDLSLMRHPVLLANGDNDRMLPTPNTLDMARRLPNNEVVIYPDAAHGGIFQYHEQFVEKALELLAKGGERC